MRTKEILKLIAEQITEDIKSELSSSSRIIKTIGYELVENGNRTDILIKAAEYFKYIDKGRRPGAKLPPRKAIEDFVKGTWDVANVIDGYLNLIEKVKF